MVFLKRNGGSTIPDGWLNIYRNSGSATSVYANAGLYTIIHGILNYFV